jgi:hypothetical protein
MHIFRRIFFDKTAEMVLPTHARNEHHVHQTHEDARAGQWLDGHLSAPVPLFWRRGIEFLNTEDFPITRDCPGSRGFSVLTINQNNRRKK